MPVLLRLAADGSSRVDTVLELPGLDCVVGRGAEAHVSVIDDSVSREHARIFLAGDRWAALSLNENNPIRVAGRAVERLDLDPGTEFSLGRVRFRFALEDPRAKSTVLVDGHDAAATIAQVKAARSAAATSSPDVGTRNPFLNPPAAPPATPSPVATPTTSSPDPASPKSPAPVSSAPVSKRRVDATEDGPGGMVRPPTALRRPRIWPKVLVAVLVLLGVAAAIFHRPLLELAGLGATGSSGGTTADDDGGDGTAETGAEAGAAAMVDDPSGALGGWRRTDPKNCDDLSKPMPEDSELGKVAALSGQPTGFMYARSGDDSSALVLEFANAGQYVEFEDGKYVGGNEGPRDEDAKPLEPKVVAGRLSADTDPRCIVRALGPAHVVLGAVPLPVETPDRGVPLGWALEGGGFMVTVGSELWAVRVDGKSVDPPQGTTWAGIIRPKYDANAERPLVLVHEGPGENRSIELLQAESSAERPSLIWKHPRREAPMDLVFEPGDEITTYVGGDETGSDPTYLHAELGLIDLPTPSLQVRPFEITFTFGEAKFDYVGTLVRTPWREE